MFTWLLVFLEIATLVGAFWYVYLKRSSIKRLNNAVWGWFEEDEVVEELRNGMLTEFLIEDDPDCDCSNVIEMSSSQQSPRQSA
jgi:hypothetical protein